MSCTQPAEVIAAPAAGLVPSKTSDTDRLEVSFDPRIVRERRIKHLRRNVWACGHLHRLAVPNGHREHVWFVTLTYRGAQDWRPRPISNCLKTIRNCCKRRGISSHHYRRHLRRDQRDDPSTAELELTISGALSFGPDAIQRR